MIRSANRDEIPVILDMCQEFHRHIGVMSSIPFDRDAVTHLLGVILDNDFLLVIDRDGEVQGFLAGNVFPALFNPNVTVASEIAWWVKPESRGTRESIELIKAAESKAENAGCAMFIMFNIQGLGSESLDKLYRRRGYSLSENSYVRVL